MAAECTCTEREFGRCSRPTVRAGRNVHDERDHCDGRDSAGARGRGSWPPAPMIPTWPGWSTVSRPRMGSSHRVREKSPARRPRVVVEDPPQSRPAPAAAGGGARWGCLAHQDPSSRSVGVVGVREPVLRAHRVGRDDVPAGEDMGTFHKLSPKQLNRYVQEFADKHNMRNSGTLSQMRHTAARLVGRNFLYRELVAKKGLSTLREAYQKG